MDRINYYDDVAFVAIILCPRLTIDRRINAIAELVKTAALAIPNVAVAPHRR